MPAFAQMESETKIQSVVALPRPACFCLEQSLFCGQAFRWERKEGAFFGVAGDRVLTVAQTEAQLLFYNASGRDVREFWVPYFSLDEDYPAVNALFARDPLLREAGKAAGGIRILRQDPWEALCSFIFSSNNNIPRITGMIRRFCRLFGQELEAGAHGFPPPDQIAGLSPEALAPVRAGFRAKYVLDAAQKAAAGGLDLQKIAALPLDEARRLLMTIKGVGPKVADCVLLFGYHRLEALPKDVWINRALAAAYPGGLPDFIRPFAGIAQQQLFHYARTTGAFS